MPQSRRHTEHDRKREQEPLHLPGDQRGADGDAVARRAYRRFEERGYEHGRDMDDWLEAEREVRQGGQAGRDSERAGRTSDGSNDAA